MSKSLFSGLLHDSLHKMAKSISWEKYLKMSSAELFTQHAKHILLSLGPSPS